MYSKSSIFFRPVVHIELFVVDEGEAREAAGQPSHHLLHLRGHHLIYFLIPSMLLPVDLF
jgi:hypothetical protein